MASLLRRALHSSLQVRLPNDAPRKAPLSLHELGDAQRWSLALVLLQTASGLLQNNSNARSSFTLSDYAATYALVDALKIVICGLLMTRERGGHGSRLQLPVSNQYTPLPRHRSPTRRSTSSSRRTSLNGSDKRPRNSSVDGETSRGRRGSIQGSGLGRRSLSNSNGGSSRSHEYPPDTNGRTALSGLPEEVILDDDIELHDPGANQVGRHHILHLVTLACLLFSRDYAATSRVKLWETVPIHTAAALSIVFAPLNEQFFLGRSAMQSLWTPALLQFCASILPSTVLPSTFYDLSIFIATPIYASLVLLALELVFKLHHTTSLFTLSLILFSISFPLHIGFFFLSSSPVSIPWSFSYLIHAVLQAGIGVTSIAVIKYTSVFAFCSLTLLSSALLLPVHGEILQAMPDQQAIQLFISALGIYGAFAFWRAWSSADSPPNSPPAESESRWLPKASSALWGTCLVLLLSLGLWSAYGEDRHGEATGHIDPLGLRDAMFIPSPASSLALSAASAQCTRPPLPPSTQWNGTRTFHTFDDVLLVVFFSHARYDVNLDAHREAYAPYFPNILYIGPASREDKGFNHSYDVFVDSYQSDEDFTGWYKMAGRMAHHMFYTAVKDNPCYSGYLWAPFDALLNVPRLAQFPQQRIWYHSPFGEYVPNPALSEIKANEKPSDKHPPPATVSTDTPRGYAEKFVPFGEDGWQWWWGEPHVGLEACWPGYQKIRKEFRDRLQGLTGQPDRFIGGSADTLYVPGALREDLLETLGYFLETDCFLEIVRAPFTFSASSQLTKLMDEQALPTTLHLILPRDQSIAFVDHWWIWTPPLNTTFVRQKWEEGLEVDSFHSFHWGDKGDDGVWRPHLNSVQDVRDLQVDSFKRQGMDFS